MGTTHRRRSGALAATVAFTALGVVALPSPATADPVIVEGPPPQEVYETFASCPAPQAFTVQPQYCLKLTASDGRLRIGNTLAEVPGPIEVIVGIGAGTDENGDTVTEIVPASSGGGGGPAAVRISGGLLGVPELDPLIDALGGLLSVSAQPLLGNPGVGRAPGQEQTEADFAFLSWLGAGMDVDVSVELPLAIKIDNLLLGSKCEIDEFVVNLTTGTSEPERGAPMTGSRGEFVHTYYASNWPLLDGGVNRHARVNARFVDNRFAVPGAEKCDLLLGDLLDQPAGLFDPLVNSQTGLPAGPGQNFADFRIDTDLISYQSLAATTWSPTTTDFGELAVGTTSETKTVQLVAIGPMFGATVVGPAQLSGSRAGDYRIVNDGCLGRVLDPGEQCAVDIQFVPTATGSRNATLRVPTDGALVSASLRGRGVTAP